MKTIKLNREILLRNYIISAVTDEDKAVFKNGVALVEAEVIVNNYDATPGKKTIKRFVLVNENFEEVYGKNGSESFLERNLMLNGFNLSADRLSDNDYIVLVDCSDGDRYWKENRHIRIIDGTPVLINKLGTWERTSDDNILIVGCITKRLYNISTGKFITPELKEIKESEIQGIFDVIASVSSDTKDPYKISENVFFKINSEGKKITFAVSSVYGVDDELARDDFDDIEDFLNVCKTRLNAIVLENQKSMHFLQEEAIKQELNRKRKMPN